MIDIYNTGTPKYQTANAIYDGLCELTQTEEAGILQQMFADVSVENQTYYYTEKGYALKEKFDELSDFGNKTWIMDLAVFQVGNQGEADELFGEIHSLVYDCLTNSELAKRLGFKKLFIEKMWHDKAEYDEIIEEYADAAHELNRFSQWEMSMSFFDVMKARGRHLPVSPYSSFCHALYEKAMGLQLQKETRLIVECRALLNSYDDFMLGLRMNQVLYEQLEHQYKEKALWLKESYEEKFKKILLIAEKQGLVLEAAGELLLLQDGRGK